MLHRTAQSIGDRDLSAPGSSCASVWHFHRRAPGLFKDAIVSDDGENVDAAGYWIAFPDITR